MVRVVGFEPTRVDTPDFLRAVRLPFRHTRTPGALDERLRHPGQAVKLLG